MVSTNDMHNDKNNSKDFSIVLGGPLYQFYLRTHLAKPALALYKRRIIFITLFAWLPLLLLSAISGNSFSGVTIPFIYDIETHARLLGALGFLIAAEIIVHEKIQLITQQFLDRNIIPAQNREQFNNIIATVYRFRNSVLAELLMLILVYSIGHWSWKEYAAPTVATWYAVPLNGQLKITLAGYWYIFVSIPIFQFILLRWYFRLSLWYCFLWKVARLKLNLNSLHPDRSGGVGFLGHSIIAFWPVLMAHTILISGFIANRIWHAEATFPQFKLEMICSVVFLMFLVLIPLCFFIPLLVKTKINGTFKYGILASHYVNDFRQKWINNSENSKALLGSSDIQSLADLFNSFEVTSKMRVLPFSRESIFQLFILIIIPLLPLILTMIPIDEIVKNTLRLFL